MKKGFKVYALIWIIVFAVFNVICFVTPNHLGGYHKIDAAFWTGYVFITLAFVGNLICANLAFKADSLKKLFYNISLITISYSGLIVMAITGGLCMAIPNLPAWLGIVVCVVVLAFHAIAVIQARAAAIVVETIDERIAEQTQFIKMLTIDAEGIMERASTKAQKEACKKVYEAVRYSDPMSNIALAALEDRIAEKMDELSTAVGEGQEDLVTDISKEVLLLVNERNRKNRFLK